MFVLIGEKPPRARNNTEYVKVMEKRCTVSERLDFIFEAEVLLSGNMVNFTYRGLMPPVLTPFNDDFSLNLGIIPKYVDFLVKQGIKGILVNGTSGEGMSMSVAERKQVTEIWIKEAHRAEIHVMVQVGGAPLPDVIELTKHAEASGADSLLTLPELFFKPSNVSDLVFYLDIVANAAPNTPLLYYHNPGYSGVQINMPSLVREASKKIKTFRGLKFTAVDLQEGAEVLAACGKNNAVFLGADTLLIAAGALGFDSAIGTTFNMLPSIAQEMMENMNRDAGANPDIRQARLLQTRLNEMISIITGYGSWVSTMKVAMELLTGILVGPPRPPLRALTDAQKKQMADELGIKQ